MFFVLLLLTLVFLQVNDTFLDPDYYPEELRKADVYEFVLVDLLTSAIDERRGLERQLVGEGLEETPLITSGLSTEDIVSSVNRAVPPDWVQDLLEQSFDQIGGYLIGERDEFEFTFRAGDQVRTLVDEVKSLLRKADAYDLLFERVVDPAIEDALAAGDLPLGVDITSDRLVEAVRTIVPPEWVQEQVEGTLDELTPYFTGERDTFEVNVQFGDRAEVALDEVKELLGESNVYDLLYGQVVEPTVTDKLGESVELPLGVTLSNEEVLSRLRRVAPPEWVREQAERVIDDAGPYLTGKTDRFATEVSLVDNKRLAKDLLAELVEAKMTALVERLPNCTSAAQLRDALNQVSQGQGLPSCIPAGVPTEQLLGRLGVDVIGQVQSAVLGPIPNKISFTDAQLRSALTLAGAGDNLDQIDTVREILRGGWTYTQDDLKAELDERS